MRILVFDPEETCSEHLPWLRQRGHTVTVFAPPIVDLKVELVLTSRIEPEQLKLLRAAMPLPCPRVVAVVPSKRVDAITAALHGGADDYLLNAPDVTMFQTLFEQLERRVARGAGSLVLSEPLLPKEDELSRVQRLEALGRLASRVAHDFNNLLTAILSCGRMLAQSIPEDSPLRVEVADIVTAGRRGAKLVRQLTEFSRSQREIEGNENVNSVIVGVGPLLQRLAGSDVSIDFDLDDQIDLVALDAAQVERVLVNLVVNSRDAIEGEGHIRIATESVLLDSTRGDLPAALAPGRYIRITVADNGSGMDEKTRQRAFEPFFTTKGDKGTGLGLSIVYGIVTKAGGEALIEPRDDGATFTLYLPAAAARAAPVASSFPVDASISPAPAPQYAGTDYRRLLDGITDAVYVADADTGKFIDVNDAACRMLLYSRAELLLLRPADLKPALLRGSKWNEQVALLRASEGFGITTVHCRSDGSQVPVDIRVTLHELDGREYVVGICRDMTQRGAAVGLLDDNQAAITRIAGWIAHQINNPLATAINNLRWVLGEENQSQEEIRVALREASVGLMQVRGALEHLSHGMRDDDESFDLSWPPASSQGAAARADDEAIASTPTSEPAPLDEPASVLLIDDDMLVATSMVRMLRPHRVRIAESGHDALSILANETFDVILCDLMMPGMSGMELYERLQVEQPNVADRVVFMTGGVFTDAGVNFVREHESRCLAKPIEYDDIHGVVRSVARVS